LRGVTHTTKRKGGELFSGTANKIRPTWDLTKRFSSF
jgi:hypothetical protein